MPLSYYAIPISPNLAVTPEGFLLAKDCVIARTGFQQYAVGDLPREKAEQLGVDVSDPKVSIDIYRPEEQVFAQATLASFEGKPICEDHPEGLVNSENFREVICGHIQNVRKGWEPLESGEWPMIGDLLIMDAGLVERVQNGTIRELSCGYRYDIAREGDKIIQIGIVGNHVAVVFKGRAGSEARINDSAHRAASVISAEDHDGNFKTKENDKVNKPNWFRRAFGLGLMALAKDAETKPEDMADAAMEGAMVDADPEDKKEKEPAEDRKMADKKMADKKAKDRKMADAGCQPGEDGHEDCTDAKCMADKKMADKAKAKDAKSNDKRGRAHRALDNVMDEMETREEQVTQDADLKELSKIFTDFMSEEEEEPEHDKKKAGDSEDDEPEDKPAGKDAGDPDKAEVVSPIPENEIDEIPESGKKYGADSDLLSQLKVLRPFVTKNGTAKDKAAFNAMLRRATGKSGAFEGTYAGFAGASTLRANDSKTPDQRNAALQESYAARHRSISTEGGK